MKHTFFLILFFFSIFSLKAQKQLKDYSIDELTTKKNEAIAEKSLANMEVYEEAIKIKTDLDAALKVEDYEKAAALQNKLNALKIIPSKTERIAEIQAEISKAVASEDYEKADALKKELDVLNNVSKPTAPPSDIKFTSSSSSSNSVKPTNVKSSNLTKNDIYGSSAVWMGLDFSLFTFVSKKKVGEEQKHYKFISIWQKDYGKAVPDKKIAHWLGKPMLMDESYNVEGLYLQNLNSQWIKESSSFLSQDKIETQLKLYKSNNHGLALVFIPGVFNETEGQLSLNVVWFDLDTRTIINLQEVSVKAGPNTMASRWIDGLIEATKTYVDKFYRKRI